MRAPAAARRFVTSWWPSRGEPTKARGLTRVVILDRWRVTVRVRRMAWWCMADSRKIGRRRQTTFKVNQINNIDITPPWIFTGVLEIDVPGGNDPWGRATSGKDGSPLIPEPRPHRIRFSRRQAGKFNVIVFGMNGSEG